MKHLKTLLLAFVFTAICTGRLAAQTPPNEPMDFTAAFTALDLSLHPGAGPKSGFADGSGFQNFLLSYPDINGVQWGTMYIDYTNKREAFRLGYQDAIPESPTSVIEVFIFYDNQLKYVYDSETNTCSKMTWTMPINPFFAFLAQSTAAPGSNNQTEVWKYQIDRVHEIEFGNASNSAETPLFLLWRSPQTITTLNFDSFTSGQPDQSVFALPGACTG